MTVSDMRVKFRQYAQQMGMQNYRTILDEQIDMLLNSSISDTLDQILKEHITTTNDGVGETNSKLGQINALRKLYRVETLTLINKDETQSNNTPPKTEYYAVVPNDVYLVVDVDSKLSYGPNTDNLVNTKMLNARVIDAQRLGNVLNDANQKPTLISPVVTIIKDEITLYVGDLPRRGNDGVYLFTIILHYIATPEKITSDSVGEYTSLPAYLHEGIIKHAIDLHRVSVAGSLYSSQAQQSQNVNANRQQRQRAGREANEE